MKDTDRCRCGLTYKECKYPISHSHPTIENIDPYHGGNVFGDAEGNHTFDYSDVTADVMRHLRARSAFASIPSPYNVTPLRCRSAECRYRG